MKTISKRLTDGQDLLTEIKNIAVQHDIAAGIVLSAVGSLKESKIRVPVIDNEVRYISPSSLEIDALHGTVSRSGCHLHITVSDLDGKAWGGHIKEGCTIRTTCELVIGILDDTVFERQPDSQTGFDELVVNVAS